MTDVRKTHFPVLQEKSPLFSETVDQKSESFKVQKLMTEVLIFSHHSPKVLLFLCAALYYHFFVTGRDM